MSDIIGGAHIQQIKYSSISFTFDRLGNPKSALNLNGGWLTVPSGVYFNSSEFSITLWIYPQQVDSRARIIDFGNGCNLDEILLAIQGDYYNSPFISLYDTEMINYASSHTPLTTNQWQFLVATYNGAYFSIYINGYLVGQSETVSIKPVPLNVLREKSCVGKSNCVKNGAGYSHSFIDDLKFYNKSLTQNEIYVLMKESDTCGADVTGKWG
jgi:hypothetical protein